MRKLVVLLVALVMIFSCSSVVLADGNNNPLSVVSVTVYGDNLEGATVYEGDEIYLLFDRGMKNNMDANFANISVKDADGNAVKIALEGTDNKSEYKLVFAETPAGNYTLVIGKDVMANNGNTLGTDYVVNFIVGDPAMDIAIAPAPKTGVSNGVYAILAVALVGIFVSLKKLKKE